MFDYKKMAMMCQENKYCYVYYYEKKDAYRALPRKDRENYRRHGFGKEIEKGFCTFEQAKCMYSEIEDRDPWNRESFLYTLPNLSKEDRKKGLETVKDGKRFKAFLIAHGLSEEYQSYIRRVYEIQAAGFSCHNEFDEPEASKEQYAKIRGWLEKLSAEHFEKTFGDSCLFELILSRRVHVYFCVMGNCGDTYGIVFYPSLFGKEQYEALFCSSKLESTTIIGSYSTTLAFYFEHLNKGVPLSSHPQYAKYLVYGEDQRYSSMINQKGINQVNRLSVSFAFLAEIYLEAAYETLLKASIKAKKARLSDDCLDITSTFPVREGYPTVRQSEIKPFNPDNPTFYVGPMKLLKDVLKFGRKKEIYMDFSLRSVPLVGTKKENGKTDDSDTRIGTMAILGVFADSETGFVYLSFLLTRKRKQSVADALAEAIKGATGNDEEIPTPVAIYFNSDVEYTYAQSIFYDIVKKKNVELIGTDETLNSDYAIDIVLEMFDRGEIPTNGADGEA